MVDGMKVTRCVGGNLEDNAMQRCDVVLGFPVAV
jgi:hypothetical protein